MKKFDFKYEFIDNIIFSNIDPNDYPVYADAFIAHADYYNIPMSEEEIDDLNDNHGDFVYEKLMEYTNGE